MVDGIAIPPFVLYNAVSHLAIGIAALDFRWRVCILMSG
jgi:hypothetical protein